MENNCPHWDTKRKECGVCRRVTNTRDHQQDASSQALVQTCPRFQKRVEAALYLSGDDASVGSFYVCQD